jgi:hypothetical protein
MSGISVIYPTGLDKILFYLRERFKPRGVSREANTLEKIMVNFIVVYNTKFYSILHYFD